MERKRERKTLHLGGDGASQPHIFLRRHDTFFFRGLQKGLHGRMAVFWPGRTFKHLGEHIKGLNGRGMQVSHWHQFTPLVVCCSIEWSLQKWEMFAGSAGGRAEYLISKRACKRNQDQLITIEEDAREGCVKSPRPRRGLFSKSLWERPSAHAF